MSYKLYVRDQSLNRVAEITDYQSLELLPRFNNTGSWVLKVPTDSKAAKELMKPRSGIIAVKNGVTILSGPTIGRNRKWNKDEDTLTINGYDDMVYLRNLAYPVPGGNFASSAYDVRTGKAETIMKQYVEANIGATALSERKILTVAADTALGNTITGRARFHTLLELFTSLALSGGDLGFRVVQVNNSLEFQVYQPADKTQSVFFSPLLGNLLDFEYSVQAPEMNYALVGGGGEGTARTILQKGDSTSISKYGRWESFIDQRSTTDTTELQQAMAEELTSKGEQTSLSITPIDTDSVAFGKDYTLGDKVSVILTQPGEMVTIETLHYFISAYQTVSVQDTKIRKIQEKLDVIQDLVREIKIIITPEGERISPVIGTPDSVSRSILGIFDKMKKVTRRVSNLERR